MKEPQKVITSLVKIKEIWIAQKIKILDRTNHKFK